MSQQIPGPYQPWPGQAPEYPQPQPPAVPPQKKRNGVRALIMILLLALAVGLILNASVFRIRSVEVVGLVNVKWEDVIRSAGLEGSVGYFSLNEKKIEAGINQNRYLIYKGMEKVFPSYLSIFVEERIPLADVQSMGVTYQLDAYGMVLERDGTVQPTGKRVLITGFQAREVLVGHIIVPGTAAHMEAYLGLMEELQLQNWLGEVSELNLSNPESLYLITKDGYTVHLGNAVNLRAKIGTVRGVVEKLREMRREGGVIEASVPGSAIYTPMDL
ncbi:MAG: FtsQ-type POTRA domain-containing protein [Clostridiales bacterium]|nr:FtsQ-type POTRA domain-containing protein [Clostridiales bacterium]